MARQTRAGFVTCNAFGRAVAAFLFFVAPFMAVSQTIQEFNEIVDFETTLKELYNAATAGQITAIPGSFYIIEGAVASRAVVRTSQEDFLGELELIGGEWDGVETAYMFRCVIQLEGPEFYAAIPQRRSRTANPAEITLNSRILIVGKLIGLRDYAGGAPIPVLRAFHIRRLN